jgi:DNA-binding NarL/FixJ family response regulator
VRALLVDDHALVRDALKRLLGVSDPAEVVEAASGEAALEVVETNDFDLIILDLNLPGVGGLELLSRLVRRGTKPHILVLTMNAEATYVRKALALGAKGYVTKNASTEELLRAIRRVGAGNEYVEAEIAQALAFDVATGGGLDTLSHRELEILRLLAAGRSLGEIAETIGIAYKTVANTCSRMKAKCNTPRTIDLIRLADHLRLS